MANSQLDLDDMAELVGKNLARVDIFYDSLNVESVTESKTYTVITYSLLVVIIIFFIHTA